MQELLSIARNDGPKLYALVILLWEGALPVQDVCDIPFSNFTKVQKNEKGNYVVHFVAKKSVARTLPFT